MRAVIVTVHNDHGLIRRAFACGARGHVLKASAGDDLVHPVDAVLARGHFVSATLASALNEAAEFVRD